MKLKGGHTRTLLVGDDAPVGGGAFVKVEGDARVFTIASFTRGNLDKKAADLRDRRLLTFDADKLARLELAAQGAPIEFARNTQNEWAVLKPRPLRADNWQVEELLRQLKEGQARRHAQRRAEEGTWPASSPPPRPWPRRRSPTPRALRSSRCTRAGRTSSTRVRVRSKASTCLLTRPARASTNHSTTSATRKLFDFGFSDPNKVEYKDSARQMTLSKAGDRWLVSSKPMDAAGVQGLIDRLRELAATKFPETGFTTPAIELTVVAKDGKLTEKVSISKAGERYIARREGEPSLYELDAKSVEELQKAADIKPEQPAKSGAKK